MEVWRATHIRIFVGLDEDALELVVTWRLPERAEALRQLDHANRPSMLRVEDGEQLLRVIGRNRIVLSGASRGH